MKKIIAITLILFASVAGAQQLGNLTGTVLTSSARTATQTLSPDITNPQWRGGHFIIDVSAYTSGTLTPTIQGKDSASGQYYDILVGSAISATGVTVLKVYPGIAASANAAASDVLPRVWRFKMTGTATPVVTYSVGSQLVQ